MPLKLIQLLDTENLIKIRAAFANQYVLKILVRTYQPIMEIQWVLKLCADYLKAQQLTTLLRDRVRSVNGSNFALAFSKCRNFNEKSVVAKNVNVTVKN